MFLVTFGVAYKTNAIIIMALFLNCSVLATSQGAVSPSQQYLLGTGQVIQIKAASAKMKVTYPAANSVVTISKPVNNVHETFDYIVAETVSTFAALT